MHAIWSDPGWHRMLIAFFEDSVHGEEGINGQQWYSRIEEKNTHNENEICTVQVISSSDGIRRLSASSQDIFNFMYIVNRFGGMYIET